MLFRPPSVSVTNTQRSTAREAEDTGAARYRNKRKGDRKSTKRVTSSPLLIWPVPFYANSASSELAGITA